jgi:mitogen-activated protein kinase 1/3
MHKINTNNNTIINNINNNELPEIKHLIGRGTFAYVVLAYDHKFQRNVAIKRSLKVNKNLSKEIKIYRMINGSEYVPELYDIYYTIDNTGTKIIQNLVFEYLSCKLKSKKNK